MKTFTQADILSWHSCYGKSKTLRTMRGLPRVMTALDVLRHERATPQDRLWCVLRSEVLSDRTSWRFAAWCARRTLEAERAAGREPDLRSWADVRIAERYALGQASDAELRAACAAAFATACAAYDAAHATAYNAARSAQVERLIELIEENEK